MNLLDNITDEQIIKFVLEHKGRCDNIEVNRIKDGEFVKVITEVWDRYDDNDKCYKFYYGPFGEIAFMKTGPELKPFNEEAKDWAILMYSCTHNIAYIEQFQQAHANAIINLEKYECDIVDKKVQELIASKNQIAQKKDSSLKTLNAFVENKLDTIKNNEQNSLLVKAFLSNMTPEERNNWLTENGFKQNTTSKNSNVEYVSLGKN